MMRQRKSWIALLMILLLFGACKGETPTAPPAGGDGGGGTTPPENATLVLTASSTSPRVNSTVVITATVTIGGQPAPNGTAVEFSSSNSSMEFTDTEETRTIRTTTNGVATAALTSAVAGTTRVTAAVNNVTRTIDITFTTEPPCVPPDPACTNFDPTITGVTPNVGRPSGGERIRITGTNFRPTVRVIFDLGNGQTRDAFVESSTATEIVAVTPAVNLGAGQQLAADVIVLTQAGTANEDRVVAADAFTFRNEQLTPVIYSITPNSGPIDGGTRVTILGEGFQTPVQVLFGSAEVQIVKADFSEIIVIAPPARLTNPNGSGPLTGPITVTVINMTANRRATLDAGFRYISKMQITGVTPLVGSAFGGTDVTIDGIGFDSKTQVFIGGVEAQVLRVSGSQLLVRTRPVAVPCVTSTVAVVVNNIDNGDTDTYGDTANELGFTVFAVTPLIVAITPSFPQPGELISVFVDDPGTGPLGVGTISIGVNGRFFIPSPRQITDPSSVQEFVIPLPLSGFTFPTEACQTSLGLAGTRLGPTEATITFRNDTTSCTNSIIIGVAPPDPNPCLTGPRPSVTQPAGGSCVTPVASLTAAPLTDQESIVISNGLEAQSLNITSVSISGANASEFSITPTTASGIAAGGSQTFTLTFDPAGTAAGGRTATVTFNTNSPTAPTLTVCVQGTANP